MIHNWNTMSAKAYFKNIRKQISTEVNEAKSEILVAVAWFTDPHFLNLLQKKLEEGILVCVIIVDDKINRDNLDFSIFESKGGQLLWLKEDPSAFSSNFMHHKFAIIDRKVVVTGSFNWTRKANKSNFENIVIHHDNDLAADYLEEFLLLKKLAGGFENTIIDLLQVAQRLRVLEQMLNFYDTDDINLQVQKLSKILPAKADCTKEILPLYEAINYIHLQQYDKALQIIKNVLKSLQGIVKADTYLIEEVKLRILILRKQIGNISISLEEAKLLIRKFEVLYIREVGHLIQQLMHLKTQLAKIKSDLFGKEENRKEYENYQKEQERFHQTFNDKQTEVKKYSKEEALSNEEQKDIRKVFREITKLAYPDLFVNEPEKQKEATALFQIVTNAYERKDLKKLLAILESLKNGTAFKDSENEITTLEKLQAELRELMLKKESLLIDLVRLYEEDDYRKVVEIDDWDQYFLNLQNDIKGQIVLLKKELKFHSREQTI
jgi:hypothetical protein